MRSDGGEKEREEGSRRNLNEKDDGGRKERGPVSEEAFAGIYRPMMVLVRFRVQLRGCLIG